MINETTESKINRVIESAIPEFEMLPFRAPSQFDGGNQPHYGFFNKETGNCVESFTAKGGYEMTTRDDYVALATAAFDAMGSEGTVKAHWTESKSRAQATIIICPSDDERRAKYDIGGVDAIYPRLLIEAPFGRTFKFNGGLYRDACRNLDIPRLADNKGFTSTFRHTASLRGQMDSLVATCKSATNFEAMVAKLNQLDQLELDIDAALATLYPLPENAGQSTVTRARSRAAAIYRRIGEEQIRLDGGLRQDGKCSGWRLVQAITGYVQHDKTRRNGMGEAERAIMGVNDGESLAAWSHVDALLAA